MSDAAPAPTREEEVLARLMERDLSAAEKVHDRLMAAESNSEIAELGRTYQRLARSVRQTVALKAKLARERAQDRVVAPWRPAVDIAGLSIDARVVELEDAVERVSAAAWPDDRERHAETMDRFYVELHDWIEEPGFVDQDLDAQVREACEDLLLPEHLIARWRTLPRPAFTPYPDEDDPDAAADPPRPWSGSG